jgi:hypothetical protein
MRLPVERRRLYHASGEPAALTRSLRRATLVLMVCS